MRAMSRIWLTLVVGASLGLTLMWVSPVRATPLNITTTTWATISSYLGAPEAVPVIDYFDFHPPTTGYDGEVISAVFKGTGSASGLFVYLYQLKIYPSSSAPYISGIAFPSPQAISPATVNGIQVFAVSDAPILFGEASPNAPLTRADWSLSSPTTSQFSFDVTLYRDNVDGGIHDPSGDSDPPYEDNISVLWGFFHPAPPTLVSSNPKDGGQDLRNPKVYTPTPEPSAIVLLSLGLLGLVKVRRRMA